MEWKWSRGVRVNEKRERAREEMKKKNESNEWVSERTMAEEKKKYTVTDTIKKCTAFVCDAFVMCVDVNVFFFSYFYGWMWNGWLSSWQSNSMLLYQQHRRNILRDDFPFINASPKLIIDTEVNMRAKEKQNNSEKKARTKEKTWNVHTHNKTTINNTQFK